jgi:oligopeptide transport system substrate-binding protein
MQVLRMGKVLPAVKLLTIAIYSDIGSFVARQLEEVGITGSG